LKSLDKIKKVGITFSSFDLLHAGHVMMLKEAKKQCDYLMVGLQLDPSLERIKKNTPSQSIIERYIQLKGSKYVDEIIPYVLEQDVKDILRSFKIDVRIIGEEYKTINFTGKEYCLKKGIEIYYNSRNHRFSSSEIKTRLKK
jgi:glycerol-3-phosphate cytidylyltransferase